MIAKAFPKQADNIDVSKAINPKLIKRDHTKMDTINIITKQATTLISALYVEFYKTGTITVDAMRAVVAATPGMSTAYCHDIIFDYVEQNYTNLYFKKAVGHTLFATLY